MNDHDESLIDAGPDPLNDFETDAENDLKEYFGCMTTNNTEKAIEIEKKYGLYGLPPAQVVESLVKIRDGDYSGYDNGLIFFDIDNPSLF